MKEKFVIEPTPEEVHKVQVNRLVDLDFHKELRMSEDEFKDKVPLPKDGKTGHVLIISEKYVSLHASVSLIEVDGRYGKNDLDLDYLFDTKEVKVPWGMFYWRYDLDDGKDYCNTTPNKCFKFIFEAKRIPGTANESIYVVAQEPEILKDHGLNCPGSRVGFKGAPCLDLCGGKGGWPHLSASYADRAYPSYGSFSFRE